MIGIAALAAAALAALTALVGYACCVAAGRAGGQEGPDDGKR